MENKIEDIDENILNKFTEDRRTFTYSKGDTRLSFALRTDTLDQIETFRELLSHAIADMDSLLKKNK